MFVCIAAAEKREAAAAEKEATKALERAERDKKKKKMNLNRRRSNAEGVGDRPAYKTTSGDRGKRNAENCSQEAASSTCPLETESANCLPEIDSGGLCPEASPSMGTLQSVSGDDNVETNSRVG